MRVAGGGRHAEACYGRTLEVRVANGLATPLGAALLAACSGKDDAAPCNCDDGDADTDSDSDTDTDLEQDTDVEQDTDTDVVQADWSNAPTFVVDTVPWSGEVVSPETSEIRVMFSVPMIPGSYSWVTMDDVTQVSGGNPHWVDDRTAALDVTLDPNLTYGIWVNKYPDYTNFESTTGEHALPFALVFRTAAE